MGVPGLFKDFTRKYPTSLIKELPRIDFMYIDFNAIIHRCHNPVFSSAAKDDEEIFRNVASYLENIYMLADPKKLIYISTDGVAPRAKINQQRSRRYHSAMEKTNLMEEKLKFVQNELGMEKEATLETEEETGDKPLIFNLNEETKIEVEEISDDYIFETNNITPGTEFMDKLDMYMINFIKYKVSSDWKDLTVIYSSSKVPGEGEQKIMEFIRKQANFTNFNHLIYSPDADLIFLSLLIDANIFLMRNNHASEEKQKKKYCNNCKEFSHETMHCGKISIYKYFYMNVSVIREQIYDSFKPVVRRPFNPKRLLNDFVLVASFLGNDFIPTLPCLDVTNSGVNNLFYILTYTYNSTGLYLTDESDVNFNGLQKFLMNLAIREDSFYRRKLDHIRRSRKRFTTVLPENQTIQEEILSKKDSKYKSNKNNEERLTQTEVTPFFEEIPLQTDSGKTLYYTKKLKVNNLRELEAVCDAYLKQICWIYRYYKAGLTCWESFFPYLYAPYARDLAVLKNFECRFETNQPLSPLEQLVCVSPPSCVEFLPKEFSQIHNEFSEFFPKVVHFDMFDKVMPYQAVGILPFLDLKLLLPRISKLLEDASPQTLWLNIFDTPKLFVNSNMPGGTRVLNMYKTLKTYLFYEFNDIKIVVKPYFGAQFNKNDLFRDEEYENNCVYGNIEFVNSRYLKK